MASSLPGNRSRCRSVSTRYSRKYRSGSGRRRIRRKSMIWMKTLVRPPLAWRMVRTSSARPGMNRSSPIRRSGPLGMSRMPVASTTSAPGCPLANRSYHVRTSGVTSPSSVARQGTMAGTQVRSARSSRPSRRGLNQQRIARLFRGRRMGVRDGILDEGRGVPHVEMCTRNGSPRRCPYQRRSAGATRAPPMSVMCRSPVRLQGAGTSRRCRRPLPPDRRCTPESHRPPGSRAACRRSRRGRRGGC